MESSRNLVDNLIDMTREYPGLVEQLIRDLRVNKDPFQLLEAFNQQAKERLLKTVVVKTTSIDNLVNKNIVIAGRGMRTSDRKVLELAREIHNVFAEHIDYARNFAGGVHISQVDEYKDVLLKTIKDVEELVDTQLIRKYVQTGARGEVIANIAEATRAKEIEGRMAAEFLTAERKYEKVLSAVQKLSGRELLIDTTGRRLTDVLYERLNVVQTATEFRWKMVNQLKKINDQVSASIGEITGQYGVNDPLEIFEDSILRKEKDTVRQMIEERIRGFQEPVLDDVIAEYQRKIGIKLDRGAVLKDLEKVEDYAGKHLKIKTITQKIDKLNWEREAMLLARTYPGEKVIKQWEEKYQRPHPEKIKVEQWERKYGLLRSKGFIKTVDKIGQKHRSKDIERFMKHNTIKEIQPAVDDVIAEINKQYIEKVGFFYELAADAKKPRLDVIDDAFLNLHKQRFAEAVAGDKQITKLEQWLKSVDRVEALSRDYKLVGYTAEEIWKTIDETSGLANLREHTIKSSMEEREALLKLDKTIKARVKEAFKEHGWAAIRTSIGGQIGDVWEKTVEKKDIDSLARTVEVFSLETIEEARRLREEQIGKAALEYEKAIGKHAFIPGSAVGGRIVEVRQPKRAEFPETVPGELRNRTVQKPVAVYEQFSLSPKDIEFSLDIKKDIRGRDLKKAVHTFNEAIREKALAKVDYDRIAQELLPKETAVSLFHGEGRGTAVPISKILEQMFMDSSSKEFTGKVVDMVRAHVPWAFSFNKASYVEEELGSIVYMALHGTLEKHGLPVDNAVKLQETLDKLSGPHLEKIQGQFLGRLIAEIYNTTGSRELDVVGSMANYIRTISEIRLDTEVSETLYNTIKVLKEKGAFGSEGVLNHMNYLEKLSLNEIQNLVKDSAKMSNWSDMPLDILSSIQDINLSIEEAIMAGNITKAEAGEEFIQRLSRNLSKEDFQKAIELKENRGLQRALVSAAPHTRDQAYRFLEGFSNLKTEVADMVETKRWGELIDLLKRQGSSEKIHSLTSYLLDSGALTTNNLMEMILSDTGREALRNLNIGSTGDIASHLEMTTKMSDVFNVHVTANIEGVEHPLDLNIGKNDVVAVSRVTGQRWIVGDKRFVEIPVTSEPHLMKDFSVPEYMPSRGRVPIVRDLGVAQDVLNAAFVGYNPDITLHAFSGLKKLQEGKSHILVGVDWETTTLPEKLPKVEISGIKPEELFHPTEAVVDVRRAIREGSELTLGGVSRANVYFKPTEQVKTATAQIIETIGERLKTEKVGEVLGSMEGETAYLRNIAKYAPDGARWANMKGNITTEQFTSLRGDVMKGLEFLEKQGVDLVQGMKTVDNVMRTAYELAKSETGKVPFIVGQNYARADYRWHRTFAKRANRTIISGTDLTSQIYDYMKVTNKTYVEKYIPSLEKLYGEMEKIVPQGDWQRLQRTIDEALASDFEGMSQRRLWRSTVEALTNIKSAINADDSVRVFEAYGALPKTYKTRVRRMIKAEFGRRIDMDALADTAGRTNRVEASAGRHLLQKTYALQDYLSALVVKGNTESLHATLDRLKLSAPDLFVGEHPEWPLIETQFLSRYYRGEQLAGHSLAAQAERELGGVKATAHLAATDVDTTFELLQAYAKKELPEAADLRYLAPGNYIARTRADHIVGAGVPAEQGRAVRKVFQIGDEVVREGGRVGLTLTSIDGSEVETLWGSNVTHLAQKLHRNFSYLPDKETAETIERAFVEDRARREVDKAMSSTRKLKELYQYTYGERDSIQKLHETYRRAKAKLEITDRVKKTGITLDDFYAHIRTPEEAVATASQEFRDIIKTARGAMKEHNFFHLDLTPGEEAIVNSVRDTRVDVSQPKYKYAGGIFDPEAVSVEITGTTYSSHRRRALDLAVDWVRSPEGKAYKAFIEEMEDLASSGLLDMGQIKQKNPTRELLTRLNELKKEIAPSVTKPAPFLYTLGTLEVAGYKSEKPLTITTTSAQRVGRRLQTAAGAISKETGMSFEEAQKALLSHFKDGGYVSQDASSIAQAAGEIYTKGKVGKLEPYMVEYSPEATIKTQEEADRFLKEAKDRILAPLIGAREGEGFEETLEKTMAVDTVSSERYRKAKAARVELGSNAFHPLVDIKVTSGLEGGTFIPTRKGRLEEALIPTEAYVRDFQTFLEMTEQNKKARNLLKEDERFKSALDILRERATDGDEEALRALGWTRAQAEAGESLITMRGRWWMKRTKDLGEKDLIALRNFLQDKRGWMRRMNRTVEVALETRTTTAETRPSPAAEAIRQINEDVKEAADVAESKKTSEAIERKVAGKSDGPPLKKAKNWKALAALGATLTVTYALTRPHDREGYLTPENMQYTGERNLQAPQQQENYRRPVPLEDASRGLNFRIKGKTRQDIDQKQLAAQAQEIIKQDIPDTNVSITLSDHRSQINEQYMGNMFTQLLKYGYVTA